MMFRRLGGVLPLFMLAAMSAFGQNRDFRTERLLLDDDNGNTIVIQTGPGPITGGTLTIPDPGGAGQFLISNPAGGSQSISGDMLPGTDATYDLGSGASRWQDIFLSGNASVDGDVSVGGQLRFIETGGGSEYVGFQAPAAVTANQIWTLPAADGTSGQVLSTDGAGALSWATAGGTVTHNATLTGNGTGASPLGINLGNSNTWTANQTFAGTFLITANARIALTNSDNNPRDVRWQEPSGTGSQYIGLRAPSVTNNGNYVFPAVMGTAGQVLSLATSNGIDSGTMQWITPGGAPSGPAGGSLAGTYPNPTIADSTITNADVAAGAGIHYSKLSLTNSIQNSDIVANAITTSKVANGTVTTSKLADSAVSGLKLLTFAVTNRHLAANAVTPDKINPTGATAGNVLKYNGTNVVWGAPASSGTSFNHTVVSNATYTIATTDDFIGCDVSANGITLTLPAANAVPAGKMLVIRVENGDASVAGRAVTINRSGTDLINYSQTSLTINQGTGIPGTAFRLFSDGVNQWWQW